jgi:hypothetical protein
MQDINNYTGDFFLEINNNYYFNDSELVTTLGSLTLRIIHHDPDLTKWQCTDLSSALKAVLLLQKKQYPFKLTGNNEILFIEVTK